MNALVRQILALLVLWGLAAAPEAGAADSLRCGTRLVSVEMLAPQVVALCGEPDFRDAWLTPHPYGGVYVADTEQWVYNFGSSQLLQVLTFRNGRLIAIESDGYGFPPRPARICDPSQVVEGPSKFRLLEACGEPVSKRSLNTFLPLDQDPGQPGYQNPRQLYQPVFREEWIYNFGPRYLLRIVTLENGRVVRVDNGDRGY